MTQLLYVQWNINPEIFRIGGFGLRYYSVLFALAFYLGYVQMRKIYQREGLSERLLSPLLIYLIVGTVVGARLGQSLFYEFDYFKNHPLEIIFPFRITSKGFEWTGYQGLASHGGAIGIIAAVALYARRYKQSFLRVLDYLAIPIALAGFFIRLGNLFNSEILGKPTTIFWGFVFQRVDPIPRHPSQLYESIGYLAIFFILYKAYRRKKNKGNGLLLGLFLMLVFSVRFLIEFTKENQESFENNLILNMGQLLSIPFILAGLYLIFTRKKTNISDPEGKSSEQL